MAFTPGTPVWTKVYNRIWWPCKIVDPTTAPLEMQDYMNRKKNPIAMVFFEREKKYDVVINMDKVSLYSCPQKMEFVKKGHSLYLKEQNGTKIQNVEMKNFIKDVIKFEEEVNGDVNIFKQFEQKDEKHKVPSKEFVKELFVSAKELKKQKRTRKSSTNCKTPLKIQTNLKSPVLKSSELKRKAPKQRTTTEKNSTKSININDEVPKDCDIGESKGVDNSLNLDCEPGCSTTLSGYNETVLNNVNDETTNISTNATEDVEHLENSKKDPILSVSGINTMNDINIESIKLTEKSNNGTDYTNLENSKDDPIPSVSGINIMNDINIESIKLTEKSNNGTDHTNLENSKDDPIPSVSSTNTINDINIETMRLLEKSNNGIDHKNQHLSDSDRLRRMLEQTLVNANSLLNDKKQNQSCSTGAELNEYKFKRSKEEEERYQTFINDIINGRKVDLKEDDTNKYTNKEKFGKKKLIENWKLPIPLVVKPISCDIIDIPTNICTELMDDYLPPPFAKRTVFKTKSMEPKNRNGKFIYPKDPDPFWDD